MNAGGKLLLTVTLIVAVVAQSPAVGVKVYIVVPTEAVLIVAGFQVPVMLFKEVVGNVPGAVPTQ